ncbi:MAG TPA: TIM barrel protein [Chthoniobacter sp.]|nr:TIM barrel protein [Chthoniobacter sp.]
MDLLLFKTLWGHTGSIDDAIAAAQKHGFDGIEGQAPSEPDFRRKLKNAGLEHIAEICTAGGYVPNRSASVADHLDSFRRQAEAAMENQPRFLTVIAGCDAWPLSASVEFFCAAMEFAGRLGIAVSFETHRSRSMFNPWITRDILQALPAMRITCDFSHWCCVCERLIDTEADVLALCAERAHHVHARVGYDQGPQVPHPAAPEYQPALEAHERWWRRIWKAQAQRGVAISTMTPEFGPDGYLQCAPFTQTPVADLVEINAWMAQREREQFARGKSAHFA